MMTQFEDKPLLALGPDGVSRIDGSIPAIPTDSLEGALILAQFARNGRYVLNEYHEQILIKHGVPTDGITISRSIPTT